MAELHHDRLDEQTRDEDRTEQRSEDTDNQRRGEALYGAVTEDEEDDTRDDRRQLTVDDGGVGVRKTVLDRQRQPLARTQLLLDAFVDDHVGVDGHTHREDDTRDTGQRQHGAERNEYAHEQEDVEQQCEVGHPARRLVEGAHVEQYQQEGDDERDHTGVDRLLTQRRTYDRILNDVRRCGNLTRFEHVGQVLGLLNGEITRNRRIAALDLLAHHRRRVDVTVEHDGYATAHVVGRQTRPFGDAVGVHRHRDLGLGTALRIGFAGVGDDRTVQRRAAVGTLDLDRIKVETAVDRLLRLALDRPLETQVGRKHLLHGGQRQVVVHRSRIGSHDSTYGSAACELRVQQRQQRVLVAVVVGARGLGRRFRFGGSHFGDQAAVRGRIGSLSDSDRLLDGRLRVREILFYHLVGTHQRRHDLAGVVGRPEFERSRTLEQLAHALRLLHARQLDQNTVRVGQALDIGLRYAEMVDTAAQDVERRVDRIVGLLAQDLLDLGVGAVGRDVLTVGADENRCQRRTVRSGAVAADELADEVLARAESLLGLRHRFDEGGIVLAVAGQRLHDVLHLNLEHDVHTAFQVQAEVQLLLLDLLVGELAETQVVDGLILNRIEVVLLPFGTLIPVVSGRIRRRLLLYAPRLERERELVDTGNRK